MMLEVDIRKKLQGFSLDARFTAGIGTTAILGPSGAGKSMLLRCIAGLEQPDGGSIISGGRILYDPGKRTDIPSRERKTGIMFQNYALFPHMTVEENIGFGIVDIDGIERRERIGKQLSLLSLEGLEKRYPYQLSGGQQQRVALARALAPGPELLLLDEPFSALDEYLRDKMICRVRDLLSGFRGVTLLVTHDAEEAYRLCSRTIVLTDGRVDAAGDTAGLFERPPTLAAARITSCRNISRASVLSGSRVEATDWNLILAAPDVPPDLTHIGIRAENITLWEGEDEGENIVECSPAFTDKTPTRVTVYLQAAGNFNLDGDSLMQWEISREEWQRLSSRPAPWRIRLDPGKLIFIR